jgi:hypothetical protein
MITIVVHSRIAWEGIIDWVGDLYEFRTGRPHPWTCPQQELPSHQPTDLSLVGPMPRFEPDPFLTPNTLRGPQLPAYHCITRIPSA